MNSLRKISAVLAVAVCALTLSACDQYQENPVETGQNSIESAQEGVQDIGNQQQDFSEFEDEGFSVDSR